MIYDTAHVQSMDGDLLGNFDRAFDLIEIVQNAPTIPAGRSRRLARRTWRRCSRRFMSVATAVSLNSSMSGRWAVLRRSNAGSIGLGG
jgi:hypothetical protein